jgi:aspartate-semialdehyde dehydrogenase
LALEDDQGGGCFSAMSQAARQQQDHEHDNNNSSEATRPISISVIPRADTGRADECEEDENDYEYPKKVFGDSYDNGKRGRRLSRSVSGHTQLPFVRCALLKS